MAFWEIQLHQKRSAGYISRWRNLANGSFNFIRNNVDRKSRAKFYVIDDRFRHAPLQIANARVLDFEQSFTRSGEIADISKFACDHTVKRRRDRGVGKVRFCFDGCRYRDLRLRLRRLEIGW